VLIEAEKGLDVAVEGLRAGGVIVVPTETVYGLAALPTVPGATGRIFELKGRDANVPLAVLCADAAQALALADDPSDALRAVAETFWPGPLTLVLRRHPGLGFELGEPATTIGLRCPDHQVMQALAREVGPIATTSANLHGKPTPELAGEVADLFGDGVAVVLDGGPCTGLPSTVIDATDPSPSGSSGWRVLRPGPLTLDEIRAAARPRG
jgi:tRNA threonylcarbamoyl adenosine modification protein (Sua5/YciO/YrdC/YwlC family)